MIDFTTIQANPIPPPMVVLQRLNNELNTENEVLRTVLKIGAGIVLIYTVFEIYEQYKNDEANKKNRLTGNKVILG